MKGVYLYLNQIKLLIQKRFKDVNDHMLELGINYEMFAINWIVTLFCGCMTPERGMDFIDNFLTNGWEEFYKMVIKIFKQESKRILE